MPSADATRGKVEATAERVRFQARTRRDATRVRRKLPVDAGPPLIEIGNPGYGGQLLPDGILDAGSVCYLIGVGEDITFDLGLIARYGVTVHAFDPVPRSTTFAAAAAAHEPRFRFHPFAVWSRDEMLTFHEPLRPGYVSQSAVDLHGTAPSFQAPGRSLVSLMAEFGDEKLDLLKVSAEGAEFAILSHVLDARLRPKIICAEFSLPADVEKVSDMADRLGAAGYRLVARSIRPGGWKLSWLGDGAG